jgi:hypothetical protein
MVLLDGDCPTANSWWELEIRSKSKLLYDWRSVSQYVLMSSPLWDLWSDITSCRKVAVLFLWGALSDERTGLQSRGTHNHTSLSHLRLAQPGGPGSRIYIPQKQGGPVYPRALASAIRESAGASCLGTNRIDNSVQNSIFCYCAFSLLRIRVYLVVVEEWLSSSVMSQYIMFS